jgi:hypothetical protein
LSDFPHLLYHLCTHHDSGEIVGQLADFIPQGGWDASRSGILRHVADDRADDSRSCDGCFRNSTVRSGRAIIAVGGNDNPSSRIHRIAGWPVQCTGCTAYCIAGSRARRHLAASGIGSPDDDGPQRQPSVISTRLGNFVSIDNATTAHEPR